MINMAYKMRFPLQDSSLSEILIIFAAEFDSKSIIISMEWLKISTSTELVRVQPEDIVFVSADGNYSDMYLFDGKPYKMTFQLHYFDDVFKKLSRNMFIRVGKSLIVNRNYIYIINLTNQELRLNGRNLRSEFRLKASKDALKELKALVEQEGDNV